MKKIVAISSLTNVVKKWDPGSFSHMATFLQPREVETLLLSCRTFLEKISKEHIVYHFKNLIQEKVLVMFGKSNSRDLDKFQKAALDCLWQDEKIDIWEFLRRVHLLLWGFNTNWFAENGAQYHMRNIFNKSPDTGQKNQHERLSNREFQVLRLMASGKLNSEIATQLVLSPKTVSTYRGRILEKLNLHSNVDIVHYCLRHQLL